MFSLGLDAGDVIRRPADVRKKEVLCDCAVAVEVRTSRDLVTGLVVVETVDLDVHPLVVYIEDTFIYEFLHKIDR